MRPLFLAALSAIAFGAQASVAGAQVEVGRLVEGVRCQADPSQSYSLYLPSGYDSTRKWPVLLVFDPRGRSVESARLFESAAEDHGWIILSSNDTRSDSGMGPNQKAVAALWPELESRYSVDRRRIYAAGFSGTVAPAMLLSQATGGIAGVFAVGGRFLPEILEDLDGAVFGAVGTTDFNNLEMRKVHRFLIEKGGPSRLYVFEGGHQWMSADIARTGVGWFELLAMRDQAAPWNKEFVTEFLAEDMAAAESLAGSGKAVQAQQRFAAIASDYEGLVDVTVAAARAEELAAGEEFRRARKAEKRQDAREERYTAEMQQVMDAFVSSPTAAPPDRLAKQLGLDELLQQADRQSDEGIVAQRLLNMVYVATSFYVTRDLLARNQYDHAASALAVACMINDDNPVVWYNRSCALARTGRTTSALDALERAVDLGFSDTALLRTDEDLDSIRGDERFEEIVAKVGGS